MTNVKQTLPSCKWALWALSLLFTFNRNVGERGSVDSVHMTVMGGNSKHETEIRLLNGEHSAGIWHRSVQPGPRADHTHVVPVSDADQVLVLQQRQAVRYSKGQELLRLWNDA